MREIARHAQVAAICDTDGATLAAASRLYPGARVYRRYADLIEDGALEAVAICVPDHQHAPIALSSLAAGLHCFCQKPMATTIDDVRRMSRAAGNATELRTQVSLDGLAHARATQVIGAIREGALGDVLELHAWTDRPGSYWDALGDPPAATRPTSFDWEQWLGETEYEGAYRPWSSPGQWRGWRALGTGALGDMGTHNCALAFAALGVTAPASAEGRWGASEPDRYPPWSRLRFVLQTKDRGDIPMQWYDGGPRPPLRLFGQIRRDENGCVIVGTRGRCYLPGSLNRYAYFLPSRRFATLRLPPLREMLGTIPDWLRACSTGAATSFPFDGIAANISEVMLYGNAATAGPQMTSVAGR